MDIFLTSTFRGNILFQGDEVRLLAGFNFSVIKWIDQDSQLSDIPPLQGDWRSYVNQGLALFLYTLIKSLVGKGSNWMP